jgi:hypothetical protein
VVFPAGTYKVDAVNSNIVLHADLVLEGQGATDNGTGAPPNYYTALTHIWLNGDNANLFVAGGHCSHIIFRRLSLGASQTVGGANLSPVGTNRKGIVFDGHAGQTVYGPVIEDCFFNNFTMGVLFNDDWAMTGDGYAPNGYAWTGQIINAADMPNIGTGDSYIYEIATVGTTNWGSLDVTVVSGSMGQAGCRFKLNSNSPAVSGTGTVHFMPIYFDWAVNPVIFRNCWFAANNYGVHINTSNADAVRLEDCVFHIPNNSSGVHLRRSGFVKLDTCFGFGNGLVGSVFAEIVGVGASGLDSVILDNCQGEHMGNFLALLKSGTNDTPPTITLRNCNHELGSDIYLGKPCDFVSIGSKVQSFIYYDSPGIRYHSILDSFYFQNYSSGPTWGPSYVSGDDKTVYTYIPGTRPCSSLGKGAIIEGYGVFGRAEATGSRPTLTAAQTGFPMFDTTLQKPIWWDGANWKDATGTNV